jgi:sec-independent protein translocase protein TatA
MGFSGIGMWELLIILLIVVMIFGTKKLKTIGGDLGGALKSFRKAMSDADKEPAEDPKLISKEDADFTGQQQARKSESETKQQA